MSEQKMNETAYYIADFFASVFMDYIAETEHFPEYWDAQQVEYIVILFNERTHNSIHVQLVPDEIHPAKTSVSCRLQAKFNRPDGQHIIELARLEANTQRDRAFTDDPNSVLTNERLNGYIKSIWAQEQRYDLQEGASK